jgi:hypothetical protein
VEKIRKERDRDRVAVETLRRDIAAHLRIIYQEAERERQTRADDARAQLATLHGRIAALWIEKGVPAFDALVAFNAELQPLQERYAEDARSLGVEAGFPVQPAPADFPAVLAVVCEALEPGRLGEGRVSPLLAEHVQACSPVAGSYHGEAPVRRTRGPELAFEAGSGRLGSFANPIDRDASDDRPVSAHAAAMEAAAGVLEDAWAD